MFQPQIEILTNSNESINTNVNLNKSIQSNMSTNQFSNNSQHKKIRFNLGKSVSLEEIAEKCPLNLTGADFYALCSDAMLCSVSEAIQTLTEKNQNETETNSRNSQSQQISQSGQDFFLVVEHRHFVEALSRLTPSVSMDEMRHYKQLQQTFDQNHNKKKKVAGENDGGDVSSKAEPKNTKMLQQLLEHVSKYQKQSPKKPNILAKEDSENPVINDFDELYELGDTNKSNQTIPTNLKKKKKKHLRPDEGDNPN